MTDAPSPEVAMARARKALVAAQVLLDAGFMPDAISRAYYASLYAAMGLLASVGLSAKTHEGVRSLVNLHFVRAGKLPSRAGRVLTHLEGDREDADYDLAAEFSAEDARSILEDAARFVESAAALLPPSG